MKILFLCTYYHRAFVFHDLRDSLRSLGHDVRVLSVAAKGDAVKEKYYSIMDEYVIHKECYSEMDRFFFFSKQAKIARCMENNYDIRQFDIIHSHTLFNGGYATYSLHKKYGIDYCVSVRGTDVNVFLQLPGFKIIGKKILNNAKAIFVLSAGVKERIFKLYSPEERQAVLKKMVLAYNGLEEFWLKNVYYRTGLNVSKEINLLCVGKINKFKNIISASKAMEVLIKKGYKFKLTVVGQILDETVKEELVNNPNVRVLEYMDKKDLITVYRNADIFVMPAVHETFGRVYAEAMTQGLPVIYSKNEGFDGIFADGTVGFAVDPYNLEEIADRIEKIIKNYNQISANATKNSAIFNWKSIAAIYESAYAKNKQ